MGKIKCCDFGNINILLRVSRRQRLIIILKRIIELVVSSREGANLSNDLSIRLANVLWHAPRLLLARLYLNQTSPLRWL